MEQIEAIKENSNCSICFDFYIDAITLYCGHSFCSDCIFHNDKLK